MADRNSVKFISLGGIGSIGKNMNLLEQGDDIMIIDCGLMFPDADLPGVDLILPDMTYVLQNADRVRGVVLTHGHEDHIGALPYLLERLALPVWGTKLTLGLLEAKLDEFRIQPGCKFIEIETHNNYEVGSFGFEPIRLNHSIPDAVGLAVYTQQGLIVHTADFKIDQTPTDGLPTDFHAFARAGAQDPIALIIDTTNCGEEGTSGSEMQVRKALFEIVEDAPGRVLMTTFASNIGRLQQAVDAAREHGRKVAITGRSMERSVRVAERLGRIEIPPHLRIDIREIDEYPDDELVILVTGSQGEPLSALSRIARGSHDWIRVHHDDTVVMSSSAIPGNEALIWKTVNGLAQQEAHVLYGEGYVHVSGHAKNEEIKLMVNLVRPRYLIPYHGEYRHMLAFRDLAQELGFAERDVFMLGPGKVVEFSGGKARLGTAVPAGSVNVDGLGVGDVGDVVLQDRRILAHDGIVLPVIAVRRDTCQAVAAPDVYSRGFVHVAESEEMIDKLRAEVARTAEDLCAQGVADPEVLHEQLRSRIGGYIERLTGRRPLVVPIIIPVDQ